MRIIYVVTSGSYSDYCIEAIFEKRIDAEALASILCDSNGVDEWEVNKRRVSTTWSLFMEKNGDLSPDYGEPTASIGDKEGIYFCDEEVGQFETKADTMKRAIKVTNERRVIILSHNLWGDDKRVKELFFSPPQQEG